MSLDIALVGDQAADAEGILRDAMETPATFHPLIEPIDPDRIRSVFSDVEVVVGDFPDGVETAPELQLIHQIGAGVENYDLDRIPADVPLCNVYFHGPAVAEHAFLFLLALRRELLPHDRNLRDGRWAIKDASGTVTELADTTLGIVGFGHIGQMLLEPAAAFGMDVVAIRGSEPSGEPPDGVRFLGGPEDLPRVLSESDAVVLALPLTEETRGLIGTTELETMSEEAVLINVARGPVVEERALYRALVSEEIAGAGIDTWYQYPDDRETCYPSTYPFHTLDNVLMTPHISGWSDRTTAQRWAFIAANIDRVARGEEPENVVMRTA